MKRAEREIKTGSCCCCSDSNDDDSDDDGNDDDSDDDGNDDDDSDDDCNAATETSFQSRLFDSLATFENTLYSSWCLIG